MKEGKGPQLNCLQRCAARGIRVFINDAGDLILEKDDKRVEVEYRKLDLGWLNRTFPIRPDWTAKEHLQRWHALIEWDHSFTYTTADQKEQRNPRWFFDDFPWAAAIPDTFELKGTR